MGNDIWLIGEVGYDITLENVIEKVSNTDKTQPLNVNIHSQGGSVYEGLAIYNYFKGLKQEVNTHSSGLVASIASIFFLAGKNRTINSTDSFLIHLPSNIGMGNAEDLEKTAKELRDIENKLADIYVNETNLTKDEAMDLMKKDEMLNVNFLQEKGFVNNIIEFKAVAKYDTNFNNNMNEQLTEKDAENLFEKFGNKLKEIFNPEDKAPSNKIVQDATGTEIDFPDVPDGTEIVVGDKATVDNKSAEGDYVMPNGDTFKFTNGELTEIMKAKQEAEKSEEVQALEAKVNELTTQNETLTNSLEEKETENTTLTASFETLTNEFTELKNMVTSNFEIDTKEKQPKDEKETKSRTNFKSKL